MGNGGGNTLFVFVFSLFFMMLGSSSKPLATTAFIKFSINVRFVFDAVVVVVVVVVVVDFDIVATCLPLKEMSIVSN